MRVSERPKAGVVPHPCLSLPLTLHSRATATAASNATPATTTPTSAPPARAADASAAGAAALTAAGEGDADDGGDTRTTEPGARLRGVDAFVQPRALPADARKPEKRAAGEAATTRVALAVALSVPFT